ncbi:hypothetical protein [Atopobium fossor]|uniref:hypothetical protein n=1 Tax=Atopobium fossor TaxID=39487 RepID=UPI000489651D|nr:hypothetical protein [Atopobium fossor]
MQLLSYIQQKIRACIAGALIGALIGSIACVSIGAVPLPSGSSFELCVYEVQAAVPFTVSPREVARDFTTLRAQKHFKQAWMVQTPAWMYMYSKHDGLVYTLIGADSIQQQELAQEQLAEYATQFFSKTYSPSDGSYRLVQQHSERITAVDAASILAPIFCAWVVTFALAGAALCVAVALYFSHQKEQSVC